MTPVQEPATDARSAAGWTRGLRLAVAHAAILACALVLFSQCGGSSDSGPGPDPIPPPPPLPAEPVLVGVGDIVVCLGGNQEVTALLLDRIAGMVFTVGDNLNGTSFTL